MPGLRNIELTWPYYHDGTRATMEEAVRDMALYQCDIVLTDAEVASIVAFLRTPSTIISKSSRFVITASSSPRERCRATSSYAR